MIHRDIKPANILLEDGHAVVADFGIARAITAASSETLTETGLGIGTPLYMSPEQGAGGHTDGRSDQYALGCMLYEMLAGEPPFTGRTTQAIMARRLTDPVPPLRTVRESVPAHVEQVINRALSKTPADRFATVRLFAEALAATNESVARSSAFRPRRPWPWVAAAAGLLAVLVGIALVRFRRSPSALLDPSLMAVFPFRLIGTDTSSNALREGMVDFLEVKFSGAGGARVVPARTALAAWHRAVGPRGEDLTQEEAHGVARRLGAGAVVLGTIVATPGRLILNGSLLDAEAGRVRAEAKVVRIGYTGSRAQCGTVPEAVEARAQAVVAGHRCFRFLPTGGSARRGRGRPRQAGPPGGPAGIPAQDDHCPRVERVRRYHGRRGCRGPPCAIRRRPDGAGPCGARGAIREYLRRGMVATDPWRCADRTSGDPATGRWQGRRVRRTAGGAAGRRRASA
jgi:TolB-like protein